MDLVNLRLLSHPFNWIFVWITLALAMMAYGMIHDHIVKSSPDASISPD